MTVGVDHDEWKWLNCTTSQPHSQQTLMLCQTIAKDCLNVLGKLVHDVRSMFGIPQECQCSNVSNAKPIPGPNAVCTYKRSYMTLLFIPFLLSNLSENWHVLLRTITNILVLILLSEKYYMTKRELLIHLWWHDHILAYCLYSICAANQPKIIWIILFLEMILKY